MMHPNSLALVLVARTRQARRTLSLSHVREVMTDLFGQHLHAARVLSLANGVAGVLSAAVLSLHAIGHAYAQLAGITSNSGIKQVDRLMGNDGISLDKLMSAWIGHAGWRSFANLCGHGLDRLRR